MIAWRAPRALAAWTLVVFAGTLPAGALEGPYAAVSTRIAVRLSERISSQEARTGDPFTFETAASVAVAGLYLPAGTHGHGVVVTARAARGAQPGELRLAARTLDLPGGDSLAIALEPGQLARTLHPESGGVAAPVAGVAISLGRDRSTNVVFDRGTPFVVLAPPPAPRSHASAAPAG